MLMMPIAKIALFMTVVSSPAADQSEDAGLSKVAIMAVVKTRFENIKDCYKRALAKDSNLSGSVVVAWSVEPDGRVSGARVVKSTMKNSEVDTCIVGEVAGWIFPKSPRKTDVSDFPFVFKGRPPATSPADGGSRSLSNPALNPTGLRPAG